MLDESAAQSQCSADRHLPLDPLYGFERSVPAPLELAGDKTICRIDSIDNMRSSIVLGATSSTRTATTSQLRSLLSIARLNNARSRLHPFICTLVRTDQTWLGRNGGLAPTSLPCSTVSGVQACPQQAFQTQPETL